VARRAYRPAFTLAHLACGKKNLTVWILVKTACYRRHGAQSNAILDAEFSPAVLRDSGLKKKFQNGIILLTRSERHFINASATGCGWLMRWRMPEGREQAIVKLQTIREGGLYGSKDSWQDQEESTSEEESRQEEEVGVILSEAIH
jgi:hypothetical protein